MSVESIKLEGKSIDPYASLSEYDGVTDFEQSVLQGLSRDCTPCFEGRAAYMKEHALLLSSRVNDVPAAILLVEDMILPCTHNYDNMDIVLAVEKRLGLNRANA